MPQLHLPVFPAGVTEITPELAVETKDGRVTYFNGQVPVFVHDADDVQTFRMITSQFCVNGNAKQADIIRAFGVPKISVVRAVRRYREQGPGGFYQPRKTRGAAVLTTDVVTTAQGLFDDGVPRKEVARRIGVKENTLSKAIAAGKIHVPAAKKKTQP